MAEIKVTASQLNAKAEELEGLNNQFKNTVNALEETETTLMGMWDGEAKDTFHQAFNNDKTQMNNYFNAIAQYVNVMRQIAAKYAQAEAANVGTASQRKY